MPSINPRAAAGAPSVAVTKLAISAVGTGRNNVDGSDKRPFGPRRTWDPDRCVEKGLPVGGDLAGLRGSVALVVSGLGCVGPAVAGIVRLGDDGHAVEFGVHASAQGGGGGGAVLFGDHGEDFVVHR
jgi:hypothetical protein